MEWPEGGRGFGVTTPVAASCHLFAVPKALGDGGGMSGGAAITMLLLGERERLPDSCNGGEVSRQPTKLCMWKAHQ